MEDSVSYEERKSCEKAKDSKICTKYQEKNERKILIGAAGRRRVKESYLWPQVARELERVYLDAMQHPAKLASAAEPSKEASWKESHRDAA